MNNIVKTLKDKYMHSSQSVQYSSWRKKATVWYEFYDGEQLNSVALAELRENKQPDIIINLIGPKIDALAATELENRTIIGMAERTFQPTDIEMAKALTAVSMQVQETDDTAFKLSEVFKDNLIGGIGWVNLIRRDGTVKTDCINPFEMVWDVDDTSAQLTNQQFVFRHYWIDVEEAKQKFPGHSAEITELAGAENSSSLPTMTNTQTSDLFGLEDDDQEPFSFVDKKRNKILIVEGQYKKPATKYRFYTDENRQKETFDESVAKNESKDGTIHKLNSYKVMVGIFTNDVLLYNEESEVQDGQFEYLPSVHKREKKTHIPYGIVKSAVDPQREYNKRRSKMMHLLNTKGVIADANAFDDPARVRREIAKPNFYLEKNPGTSVEIQENMQLAEGQRQVMLQSADDIENTTGIYNEVLGQQTNASSGVAINRRQAASTRTKAFAIDGFRHFKKRFGRSLLANILATIDENYIVSLFGEAQGEGIIILNEAKTDAQGKKTYSNDTQTVNFDIVIEQSPAYDAPPEELAEALMNVAMNGQLEVVLQSKTLAKAFGLKYIDQIQKELQASAPSQPQQADGEATSAEAINPTQPPLPQ